MLRGALFGLLAFVPGSLLCLHAHATRTLAVTSDRVVGVSLRAGRTCGGRDTGTAAQGAHLQPAALAAVASPGSVPGAELGSVPVHARFLNEENTLEASSNVLEMRDGLQVVGVHAGAIATEVIEFDAPVDRAAQFLPQPSMRLRRTLRSEGAVAESALPTGSLPATGADAVLVDFCPELLVEPRVTFGHRQPHTLMVRPGTLARRRALPFLAQGSSCGSP